MADNGDVKPGSVEAFQKRIESAYEAIDSGEPVVDEVTPPPVSEPVVEEVTEEVTEEAATAEEAADEAEAALGAEATEEEIEQARQAAADDFYAGRYKTREETEKALKEQISLIGRQGQELGELKKKLEEQAVEAEVAEQPQELDRNAWNEWAQEQVEAGVGADGAIAALREGGYAGYEIYLAKWLTAEEDEQRAAAVLFNNAMMMRMTAEQREQSAAQETVIDEDSETQAARQIAASKRPDFEEMQPYMNDALQEMTPEDRAWLSTLAESGVEGKVRALDQLYLEAKARSGDSRSRAAAVAARQTEASSDRAKLAASDTPSVASKTRTPLPEAEQVAIAYGNERRKIWGTPLKEG